MTLFRNGFQFFTRNFDRIHLGLAAVGGTFGTAYGSFIVAKQVTHHANDTWIQRRAQDTIALVGVAAAGAIGLTISPYIIPFFGLGCAIRHFYPERFCDSL